MSCTCNRNPGGRRGREPQAPGKVPIVEAMVPRQGQSGGTRTRCKCSMDIARRMHRIVFVRERRAHLDWLSGRAMRAVRVSWVAGALGRICPSGSELTWHKVQPAGDTRQADPVMQTRVRTCTYVDIIRLPDAEKDKSRYWIRRIEGCQRRTGEARRTTET